MRPGRRGHEAAPASSRMNRMPPGLEKICAIARIAVRRTSLSSLADSVSMKRSHSMR